MAMLPPTTTTVQSMQITTMIEQPVHEALNEATQPQPNPTEVDNVHTEKAGVNVEVIKDDKPEDGTDAIAPEEAKNDTNNSDQQPSLNVNDTGNATGILEADVNMGDE